MTAPKEYRSKARIYFDILNQIAEEGGRAGPTRILYGANLSHDRLTKHLAQLINLGLIVEEKEEDRVFYSLTEKGMAFIQEFRRIQAFAKAFGIPI
ncbi:MAG: winged helix DNA-binding protein [Thaumarchaeota archaeon]|nr:winged helix DNA-binding protein [Nitrososphaerota archaeon]